MECPHCHKEIPGKNCSECGALIPLESQYCLDCGARLQEAEVEAEAEGVLNGEDPFGLDNRILCPDGTCTGIIVDGKCTECGKPYKKGVSKE